MQANTEKFQALTVGKKTSDQNMSFKIGDIDLKADVGNVKLLGVKIDPLLNFDEHVKTICLKASRQANALGRISKYLTLKSRQAIYHTFILSNFNFCPLVWHFCSKENTQKLEKVNYRALRFVYRDFDTSYEDLLKRSKACSLELSRIKMVAIETFKILYNIGPVYMKDFVTEKKNSYHFRYNKLLDIPRTKTVRYGTNSFKNLAATTWNSLPDHLPTVTSLNQFKNMIRQWNGKQCRCSLCRC